MKGIDASYHYEGYTAFKAEELSSTDLEEEEELEQ